MIRSNNSSGSAPHPIFDTSPNSSGRPTPPETSAKSPKSSSAAAKATASPCLTLLNPAPSARTAARHTTHKTYLATETAIHLALCRFLATRNPTITVRNFCLLAGISPPTFYLHYPDLNSALLAYERTIRDSLSRSLNSITKREPIFATLLSCIWHYRNYFSAAAKVMDSHLLSHLIESALAPTLSTISSRRTRTFYLGAIRALITTWILVDHLSRNKIPLYVQKLKYIRPLDLSS